MNKCSKCGKEITEGKKCYYCKKKDEEFIQNVIKGATAVIGVVITVVGTLAVIIKKK